MISDEGAEGVQKATRFLSWNSVLRSLEILSRSSIRQCLSILVKRGRWSSYAGSRLHVFDSAPLLCPPCGQSFMFDGTLTVLSRGSKRKMEEGVAASHPDVAGRRA